MVPNPTRGCRAGRTDRRDHSPQPHQGLQGWMDRQTGPGLRTPRGCRARGTDRQGPWSPTSLEAARLGLDRWIDGTTVPNPTRSRRTGWTDRRHHGPQPTGAAGLVAPAVAFADISVSAGFACAAGKVPRWEGPAPPAAPAASPGTPDRGGREGPGLTPPRGQATSPSCLGATQLAPPALEALGDHFPHGTPSPSVETKEGPRRAPLPPTPYRTPGCPPPPSPGLC